MRNPSAPRTSVSRRSLTSIAPIAPTIAMVGFLGLALVAPSCKSKPVPELTKDEKLGLYFENALRYFNLRDLDRAQHQVEQGLRLDPENERLQLMLGNIFLLRGTRDSILTAETIFRENPNQDDYRVKLGLGEALERKGVMQDAAARAIRSGERFTEATDPEARAAELAALAIVSWTEANAKYEEAIQIHTGEIAATNGLIRTSTLLGWDAHAIVWARELIEVLEASSRVRRLELEDASIEARRERELRNAIAANTNMIIKAHLTIASIYYGLEDKELALDELGKVIELDPELAEGYSRRAQVFYEIGQYRKAKDSIDHYLKLSHELPFDDESIREAYDLLSKCKSAIANVDLRSGD